MAVGTGNGVAVGAAVGVGVGLGTAVGVGEGSGAAVGDGVGAGAGVGSGVSVGKGVGVGAIVGTGVASLSHASATASTSALAPTAAFHARLQKKVPCTITHPGRDRRRHSLGRRLS